MLIGLYDLGSGVLGYQGAQGSQGHQGVPTNTDCYWFCLFCELQYPCFALLYLSFEAAVSAFLTDVSKFGTAVILLLSCCIGFVGSSFRFWGTRGG